MPTIPTLTKRPKNITISQAYQPKELPQGVIPEVAQIDGMVGYPQSYSLDCEIRSVVDFEAFFGVVITEFDFLSMLPRSDDPEQWLVGNYNDASGNILPNSYGMYAYPLAAVLRSYKVNAFDVKGVTYEDLIIEIASGRPVIV